MDRIPLIKEDFGRVLYAPLPSPEERGEILKALALCKPIDAEVDLMALGKDDACHNFNGADLFTLVSAILVNFFKSDENYWCSGLTIN